MHDFVLAGQYLVFFISPVRLNPLPILIGLSSFSDALDWQPQLGTHFLVFDRNLTLVCRGETEPWYQWHFANGYVDDRGDIIVDVVRYEDFQTNQYLKEVAAGKTHTSANSALWQIRLNPQTQLITTQNLFDCQCEFPVIPPHLIGKPSQQTYLLVHRPKADPSQEMFGAIARFEQHQTVTIADCGANCYPAEPIYAPDTANPERGWIVTVVYDGNTDSSEVWIFDGDRLQEPPVCRLGLPEVIPMGFHGTWKPA